MSEALLRVENLKTWLRSGDEVVRALDGVGFEIARGETFAIVGESGCGKSMTALSLLRLVPETGQIVDGSVTLDGVELLSLPEAAMRTVRGRRIAIIFQEPATSLNPVLTVGEQIDEVLVRHTDHRGARARGRARALLDAVGITDAERRLDDYPFQLSGGMKQRVMIAMAIAAEPDLLVADEPTTALDVTIQAQVLDLLAEVQAQRGMAMLLITHDLAIVAKMAHRVGVMYAGELVEIASREQFFRTPQHPYARKLFAALPDRTKRGTALTAIRGTVPPLSARFAGCRFVERCDLAIERCRVEAPSWTAFAGNHQVRCHLREQGRAGPLEAQRQTEAVAPPDLGPPHRLLEVRDLSVHFPIRKGLLQRTVGYVKAVDGVSIAIPEGRTVALVGESGCGKTTAGKAILQLVPPTGGEVVFDGVDLARLTPSQMDRYRGAVQIVFQDPFASLNPRMRVIDILTEGMASLGILESDEARSRRVDELLEQVGLPIGARTRYPHEFSGGQRQRIAIARALAVNPRLIVCDEPTSALDVSVQAQIINLLKDLQERFGLAYLFITHNLAVVEYLAHEVAVMYLGRIVECGLADEVLRTPKHPYTQALLSAVPTIELDRARPVVRLQGELPSPVAPLAGCHFHPRCAQAMARCREAYPRATMFNASHAVSCHLYGELP
ncbi:MAG: ABC transporter ATP-binding protein [Burkholderiales bacterium]